MDKLDRLVLAANDKDVNALRHAVAHMDEDVSFAPLLAQLLLEAWHDSHEEIVAGLGLMGHHGAVTAISRAAVTPATYLVKQNKLHGFQRKCVYALARIGTIEARAALADLATSTDPHLSEYAREGLAMWPLPFRKR